MRVTRLGTAGLSLALGLGFGAASLRDAGASTEEAVRSAQGALGYVSQNLGGVQSAVAIAKADRPSAEVRLTTGELLYRSHDYDHAAVILGEILEEYPDTPSYPDALWLLGETYYGMRDYLAARRSYRALVDHGHEPRYQGYFGRALARLVDVALRLDEPPEILAALYDKFNQVPPAQVDAALLYSKGKALYRRAMWNEAGQSFAEVARGSAYTHQARYFQGLVAMKAARAAAAFAGAKKAPAVNYKPAIEQFRGVTELAPDTAEHRHVIDLAWLAIGRLFYEMEQYQQASEAYAKVGRDSPEFDTMLYELAWVYVRLGDVERAERTLEVLTVTDPNSPFIADGTLLRADLLLRAGAFDRALQLYESVRAQYDPMRAKIDAFLDSTKDPATYYDRLAQQQLDLLDQREQLPPLAVRWAREAEDGPLAFAVIDDVNGCKTLIRETNELVARLETFTHGATRVRAFPELEAGERTALGLLNRLSRGRLALARELDEQEPSVVGADMREIRDRRRTLMAAIEALPVDREDFARREEEGTTRWNLLSQELTRRASEVDALQATINGLHRMLSPAAPQGAARDPMVVAKFAAQLDATELDIRRYRESVGELRRQVEIARAEIGLGDARYQRDVGFRNEFRDLLEREMQLAGSGSAGTSVEPLARSAMGLLAQMRDYENRLIAVVQDFEAQVAIRSAELQRKIGIERDNVARYQQQLDALDNDARDLVGHVAQRNFGLVRDRLRSIVLRADVGVTEQAWEVREEELDRVRSLQTERARQEQVLDEELKEVRDDGVDSTQASP